jgi:two-component system, NarL family, nitrate/nitrite response regulator NarL
VGPNTLASRPVTVAVVDDHQVVLDGIRWWVEHDAEQRLALVATGLWVDSVLAGPGRHADVLVLDLGLFGETVVGRVEELAAGRRVVAFSAETADETVRAVLDAGASAYLTKNEGSDHFIEVVVAAAQDRPYVTPSVAKAMLNDRSPGRPKLSAQEERALRLWFQQPKKLNVAREMGISVDTVDQYISRARVKYAAAGRPASNKAAMVARAIEDGLVRPEDVR